MQFDSEAFGQRGSIETEIDWAAHEDPSLFEHQDVGHSWRYFVEMVRDDDDWRGLGVSGPGRERSDQLFAPSEIEAGARLVEDDETRIVHQGSCEKNPLKFAR